jgi:hypothetical protein
MPIDLEARRVDFYRDAVVKLMFERQMSEILVVHPVIRT